MALDYTALAAVATELITDNGRPFTLMRGSQTPATSARPWGVRETDAVATDDVSIVANGVFLDQERADSATGGFSIARTANPISDRGARLLIEPLPALATAGFDRTETDWYVIDGTDLRYEVASVDVIKPAGTIVYYDVQLRL